MCYFQITDYSAYLFKFFLQFFALSGFPCPSLMNPSDHFLRTINKDFDKVRSRHAAFNRLAHT
jgi:hypothetical protein